MGAGRVGGGVRVVKAQGRAPKPPATTSHAPHTFPILPDGGRQPDLAVGGLLVEHVRALVAECERDHARAVLNVGARHVRAIHKVFQGIRQVVQQGVGGGVVGGVRRGVVVGGAGGKGAGGGGAGSVGGF